MTSKGPWGRSSSYKEGEIEYSTYQTYLLITRDAYDSVL